MERHLHTQYWSLLIKNTGHHIHIHIKENNQPQVPCKDTLCFQMLNHS